MAIRQRADGRWVVYYRSKDGSNKTVEEYMGRGPEGEAAAIARNEEIKIRTYKKKPSSRGGPRFEDLAVAYIKNKNFQPYSKKHLKIRLEVNILPFFGYRPALDLTFADMDRYVQKRLADGVKFSTITRELTDVKAILNWSVKRQPPMIPINPVRDYQKPKTDDAIINPPSREETKKIIDAAAPHLKRAIILSAYTGLRPGAVELLSLTWGSVNWERRSIHILSAHKGGPVRREVPLHSSVFDKMKIWFDEDKKTFAKSELNVHYVPIVHYRMRPIGKIQKSWKSALENAGISRRIRPYDLRHQFITRALENNADLKTVSEIVGSAPKTILKHYQHVSNKLRRQTIDNMDSIFDDD